MSSIQKLRCAVYTRKSSEEGLDQEFNSLDAQREACSAFIASQVGLGWKLVYDRYDDGGISGGTMERPALKRLLADIAAKKVDVVVVYKIDRLTRALADFAKIVEVFDGNGVSFVSVTQQFNTTTSMGRLTLNVLLSFAQFEREVTAERIRDKIAASKKKGMWMGGTVPLGYKVESRKLLIKEPEASFVRHLFDRYLELRSVPALAAEVTAHADAMDQDDPATSGMSPPQVYTRRCRAGMLYNLLANPLYVGKLKHKDSVHDGEHQLIVDAMVFDKVQQLLAEQAATPRGSSAHADVHLLTGLLVDDAGDRMSPTHARARGKRYRYYISGRINGAKRTDTTAWRIPAPELDSTVTRFIARLLSDRSRLVEWIGMYAPTADIKRCLDAAATIQTKFANDRTADQRVMLLTLVHKIALGTAAITFTIDAAALVSMLQDGMSTAHPSVPDDHEQTDALVTIDFPVTIKRRGNEMRLIIHNDDLARIPDQSLVMMVARAQLYLQHLTHSPGISVTDAAEHFGVHRVDVGRILPLAFLAPKLIDQILSGNQPMDISARRLARDNLPLLWVDQLAALS